MAKANPSNRLQHGKDANLENLPMSWSLHRVDQKSITHPLWLMLSFSGPFPARGIHSMLGIASSRRSHAVVHVLASWRYRGTCDARNLEFHGRYEAQDIIYCVDLPFTIFAAFSQGWLFLRLSRRATVNLLELISLV